jgi:peptidoglycan/xylan/chitin deacetylase (PgdA/CDA1 family)
MMLIGFVARTIFDVREPDPLTPSPDEWTQRDGFVAVSYAGISRLEKRGTRSVPRDLFRGHMRALKEAGYNIVTTKDIVDYYWDGRPLPERALYLMFEGGRKDSAIFAQRALRELNMRASMYIQTARLKRGNRFFIKAPELRVLSRSPYWDIGSQGYELRHINVMPDEGYGFYLTDYLRDKRGNQAETDEEMLARIAEDYERSYYPIEKYAGAPPESYVFMPANSLWRSLDGLVEEANALQLSRYYKIAFAREGSSYNTRETAPFNLTRMQVFPEWSVNRLLMEIETASPHRHVYEQANESARLLWRADAGALSSSEDGLILTARKGEDALAWLRGSDAWDNVDVSVTFSGSPRGEQRLFLRYASNRSNVCVRLSRNRVTITESVPGRGAQTLFEAPFDYGASPEKLRLTLIGNRLSVRAGEREEPMSREPIPVSSAIRRGRAAIGALGEDEPYDAVVDRLEMRPIGHLWIMPDPVFDAPERAGDIRTCTIIPVGDHGADWETHGARALYRALDTGQSVFAQLPPGVSDLSVLDGTWSTLPGGLLRAFLSGVVLTPGDSPNWDEMEAVSAAARARGMEVAIRLSREAALSLAETDAALRADWLLSDFREPLPSEVDIALKRRYDRRHILSAPNEDAGAPVIYADLSALDWS